MASSATVLMLIKNNKSASAAAKPNKPTTGAPFSPMATVSKANSVVQTLLGKVRSVFK